MLIVFTRRSWCSVRFQPRVMPRTLLIAATIAKKRILPWQNLSIQQVDEPESNLSRPRDRPAGMPPQQSGADGMMDSSFQRIVHHTVVRGYAEVREELRCAPWSLLFDRISAGLIGHKTWFTAVNLTLQACKHRGNTFFHFYGSTSAYKSNNFFRRTLPGCEKPYVTFWLFDYIRHRCKRRVIPSFTFAC